MTDKYDDLKTKIRGMRTTDNTYLPTGLIWGVARYFVGRTLS